MGKGLRFRRGGGNGGTQGTSRADLECEFCAGWEALCYGERGRDGETVEILLRTVRIVEVNASMDGISGKPAARKLAGGGFIDWV